MIHLIIHCAGPSVDHEFFPRSGFKRNWVEWCDSLHTNCRFSFSWETAMKERIERVQHVMLSTLNDGVILIFSSTADEPVSRDHCRTPIRLWIFSKASGKTNGPKLKCIQSYRALLMSKCRNSISIYWKSTTFKRQAKFQFWSDLQIWVKHLAHFLL